MSQSCINPEYISLKLTMNDNITMHKDGVYAFNNLKKYFFIKDVKITNDKEAIVILDEREVNFFVDNLIDYFYIEPVVDDNENVKSSSPSVPVVENMVEKTVSLMQQCVVDVIAEDKSYDNSEVQITDSVIDSNDEIMSLTSDKIDKLDDSYDFASLLNKLVLKSAEIKTKFTETTEEIESNREFIADLSDQYNNKIHTYYDARECEKEYYLFFEHLVELQEKASNLDKLWYNLQQLVQKVKERASYKSKITKETIEQKHVISKDDITNHVSEFMEMKKEILDDIDEFKPLDEFDMKKQIDAQIEMYYSTYDNLINQLKEKVEMNKVKKEHKYCSINIFSSQYTCLYIFQQGAIKNFKNYLTKKGYPFWSDCFGLKVQLY